MDVSAEVIEADTDWAENVEISVKMLFEDNEKEPLIKDMLKCLMFMEAEVEEVDVEADLTGKKKAKEQSDNWFNFNA